MHVIHWKKQAINVLVKIGRKIAIDSPANAEKMVNWPYSTFHLLAGKDIYPADWAGGDEGDTDYQE